MSVSEATERNWKRLKPELSGKLKHGANKSRSEKRIRPKEYFSHPENIPAVEKFIDFCLEKKMTKETILFSATVNLLVQAGIFHHSHVQAFLKQYAFSADERISRWPLPENERDLPGILYQYLLTEGEKNCRGAYYTPYTVVSGMTAGLQFDCNKLFLDPCCGSGSFLLDLPSASPEQLYGCDRDPLAVFLAGVNLLLKYPEHRFTPRIFCCDYLKAETELPDHFDFIVTNPPWGASKNNSTGESFSSFFRKAFCRLKEGGTIRFLFPESVLNVKYHQNLREMLLERTCLKSITLYHGRFTGVMTGFASVEAEKGEPAERFILRKDETELERSVGGVMASEGKVIAFCSEEDSRLMQFLAEKKAYTLSGSLFALGIVTGDNASLLKTVQEPGTEAVCTGKEVEYYTLKAPCRFLRFDRSRFQQTAKEEFYRAEEKLIYRFISDKPVFAYDNHKLLCLNSANILIPRIPGMSIKTVLAFLNSKVLQYYYMHLSCGIKVLKSTLCRLPFPAVSPDTDKEISSLVDRVLSGDRDADSFIQNLIVRCYDLTPEMQSLMQTSFNVGNVNIC